MKIGVIYNKYIENEQAIVETIRQTLMSRSDFSIMDSENIVGRFDFVFAVGGDGTIIKVAKSFAGTQTPVMGINLGRLGFLAQSDLADLTEIVESVLSGKYITEARVLLESEYDIALNDFVIKGSEQARTTKFIIKINDEITSEYVADGLIISTPTGSTAYCLSAGGPIISPKVPAFVIVPICPHTLTARPLVIPDTEKFEIASAKGEAPLTIASDGHDLSHTTNSIVISKSFKQVSLAFLEDNRFYKVLSKKLYWGVAPCNKTL